MTDNSNAIRKSHPVDENGTDAKACGGAQLSEITTTEQFSAYILETWPMPSCGSMIEKRHIN